MIATEIQRSLFFFKKKQQLKLHVEFLFTVQKNS